MSGTASDAPTEIENRGEKLALDLELVLEQWRNRPRWNGEKMKYALVHAVNGCGGIAFFYADKPKAGHELQISKARFPDGTQPKLGGDVCCGFCQCGVKISDLRLVNRATLH